jgi:hypothetical protein
LPVVDFQLPTDESAIENWAMFGQLQQPEQSELNPNSR